jgi:hypothetical protein
VKGHILRPLVEIDGIGGATTDVGLQPVNANHPSHEVMKPFHKFSVNIN